MSHLQHFLHTHRTSLHKTASYYVMHIVVAAGVAYAVTGSWQAALALSLIEPSVQALAYFGHDRIWSRWGHTGWRRYVQALSYYVMHLAVAASVAVMVTGNWWQALSLSVLEPTVQMLFFYVHERLWERRLQAQSLSLHSPYEVSA